MPTPTLDSEQRKVLQRILQVGRQVGASPKEIKAAVETGLVESNLRNLPGGDADSAGWRQERASLYPNPTNLDASIRRFFTETSAAKSGHARAGDLAAAVQRPAAQYRGRYQDNSEEADALLSRTSGGTGSGSQSRNPRSTVTRTTGGVDNTAARGALIASFLQGGDTRFTQGTAAADIQARDPLQFALGLRSLKDIPGKTSTTTRASPSSEPTSSEPTSSGPTGSKVLELIYNDGGKGFGIKNGQVVDGPSVFSAVWDGHANHVHAAAGPKTIVALGKYAQKLGLHVGENSHFGGVDAGAHVPGSYHVKDEAIDVSGPMTPSGKALMKRFATAVANYNRTRALPT